MNKSLKLLDAKIIDIMSNTQKLQPNTRRWRGQKHSSVAEERNAQSRSAEINSVGKIPECGLVINQLGIRNFQLQIRD